MSAIYAAHVGACWREQCRNTHRKFRRIQFEDGGSVKLSPVCGFRAGGIRGGHKSTQPSRRRFKESNVSRTAADAVPMPKPKPRAMRVQLVVPSIRSREVTWA